MEGDRHFQYVGQFLYSLLSLFDLVDKAGRCKDKKQ